MPYTSSNIPETIFYSAMVGEFLRIAHSTMLYKDFLPKATELVRRLNNQGAARHTSSRNIRKIMHRHLDEFSRFGMDPERIIDDVINLR